MLTLAIEAPDGAGRAPQFEAALAHCKPLSRPRALYDNIEALPAFREWARTHGLPVYRGWGFWHDDVTLKLDSVHPLARILKVPELRARALCGPSIEAAFIAHTMDRITNARSLSRDIGVSYGAAHAAVERLVGRGLLLRHRNGVRQPLHSPARFAPRVRRQSASTTMPPRVDPAPECGVGSGYALNNARSMRASIPSSRLSSSPRRTQYE